MPSPAEGMHFARYLGGRHALYRCERCGCSWFAEAGERPKTTCTPTPQWLRDHPSERREQ